MRNKNNFVNCDGQLFVRAEAIAHILVFLADGLRLVFFGRSKSRPGPPYLSAEDAISWLNKEMEKDYARQGKSHKIYEGMIEDINTMKARLQQESAR